MLKHNNREYNIVKLICECGMLVKGTSEEHAKGNLRNHKKSAKHKELMEEKKSVEKKE